MYSHSICKVNLTVFVIATDLDGRRQRKPWESGKSWSSTGLYWFNNLVRQEGLEY